MGIPPVWGAHAPGPDERYHVEFKLTDPVSKTRIPYAEVTFAVAGQGEIENELRAEYSDPDDAREHEAGEGYRVTSSTVRGYSAMTQPQQIVPLESSA
jgi:hypothetical protein